MHINEIQHEMPHLKEQKKVKQKEKFYVILILRKWHFFLKYWYGFAFVNNYWLDILLIITVRSPFLFTWCPASSLLSFMLMLSVFVIENSCLLHFPLHAWLSEWIAVMLVNRCPMTLSLDIGKDQIWKQSNFFCHMLDYRHDSVVRSFLWGALEKLIKIICKDVSASTVY